MSVAFVWQRGIRSFSSRARISLTDSPMESKSQEKICLEELAPAKHCILELVLEILWF